LEYIQAWCPWTTQDKDALVKVQKQAVTMVSGLKGSTYEEKSREFGANHTGRVKATA
jgi:hypothetical protein